MKTTQRLAFCGALCAIAVVFLVMTVFPYATYALAALAGIALLPSVLECGMRYALMCYVVSATVAFFITPDTEAKLLFILFFGYYPIVQLRCSLWKHRALSWIVKGLIFNAAAMADFWLLMTVFGAPKESFSIGGVYLPWLLLFLGNVVFVFYDIALTQVAAFYRVRLHPIVRKFFYSF